MEDEPEKSTEAWHLFLSIFFTLLFLAFIGLFLRQGATVFDGGFSSSSVKNSRGYFEPEDGGLAFGLCILFTGMWFSWSGYREDRRKRLRGKIEEIVESENEIPPAPRKRKPRKKSI